MATSARNSTGYQQFLYLVEKANPHEDMVAAADNVSSHNSLATRTWQMLSVALFDGVHVVFGGDG